MSLPRNLPERGALHDLLCIAPGRRTRRVQPAPRQTRANLQVSTTKSQETADHGHGVESQRPRGACPCNALVTRIVAVRLGEPGRDDAGDRGGQPLADRRGASLAAGAGLGHRPGGVMMSAAVRGTGTPFGWMAGDGELTGEEILQRVISRSDHVAHAEMLIGVAVGFEIDVVRIQAAD